MIATNRAAWYEHPLFGSRIVKMDPLSFIKSLEVIFTHRFVLVKQNRNFKRKYDNKQFKYKIISSLGCKYLWPNVVLFYCIPSSSYSKDDLSFWQFWKIIVTRVVERCIGRAGEGLLHTRISRSKWKHSRLVEKLQAIVSTNITFSKMYPRFSNQRRLFLSCLSATAVTSSVCLTYWLFHIWLMVYLKAT